MPSSLYSPLSVPRWCRDCGRRFKPARWYALICPACALRKVMRLPWRHALFYPDPRGRR